MNKLLPIETPNPYFGLYLYPEAKEMMEIQQENNWFAAEIKVESDEHDYRHVMPRNSYKATSIILQSFVEIEQKVGEVWETIATWFPHSEIEGCAIQFAAMEKSVHAFFYQKMSDVLNLSPEEVAESQQKIKVLKDKLEYLTEITSNLGRNKLVSLAVLAAIEQVLLFSNFAVLKSFGANGHNLIPHTISGVNYVIDDEVFHGEFAKYLFNKYTEESLKHGRVISETVSEDIVDTIKEIVFHEDNMLDYIYEDEDMINDIYAKDIKIFIRSRANMVLEGLGIDPIYTIDANPIAEWFYRGANSIKSHDFFSSTTNQYSRKWSEESFSLLDFIKDTDETSIY